MRDVTIINGFKNLQKIIAAVDDQTKAALAGEMMMQQAMRKTLVKKGIFTDKDLADSLSEIIEENNKAAKEHAEKEKKQLIKPSTVETAKIDASKKATLPEKAPLPETPKSI